ncbi:isoprenoid synthase domain-containing protein [Podospora fimiseda]|uniref:Terpene synthase n=1 Tax=Podospora fimiseda TaxID=252190 RepID=A0AAN7H1P5_9PEZI|nr:isoprenoid synthase domain-containing protein [Podospora fimiseda]
MLVTDIEIRLPHLEDLWKWPRLVNPHLAEINQECLEWSASFGAFDAEMQRLVHEKGKLNLLAAMCYARMPRDFLKTGCDLMHLFFMFDEHSDRASPEEVWNQASIQIDAFNNPETPRPRDEWVGGEFARQFFLRIPKSATETFKQRFLATWVDYVESVAEQAEHRSQSRILDLDTYFPLRRNTSGAPSTIALYEMDLDIPEDIRRHPILVELEELAVDLIVIANDLLSYNKEQAVGDDEHNIVTIIMNQFGLGMQDAIDRAGELSAAKMERFECLYRRLPRWVGPIDLEVQKLVDGMAYCVSGVLHWSYESQRYFGTRGLEVKKTRKLWLLPRKRMIL